MIANPPLPDWPLLVIDDNGLNLRLISFLLRSGGLPLQTADTAEQALDLLARERFSLVLVDVQLPGIDGLELTRRIRSTPETARLPVVAVTACSMPGDKERILAAGCNGYLSKPIDTRSFVKSVREFL